MKAKGLVFLVLFVISLMSAPGLVSSVTANAAAVAAAKEGSQTAEFTASRQSYDLTAALINGRVFLHRAGIKNTYLTNPSEEILVLVKPEYFDGRELISTKEYFTAYFTNKGFKVIMVIVDTYHQDLIIYYQHQK